MMNHVSKIRCSQEVRGLRPRSWQIGGVAITPAGRGSLGGSEGKEIMRARHESLSPNSGGGADHKSAPLLAFGPGQESACIETGWRRDGDGYGHRGKLSAHRVACEEAHGPPPFPGAEALHSCDNPPCINGAHLRWGTHAENVAEQFTRGNHRNFRSYGAYTCGACGEQGHNVRTCGTGRERSDLRRRRHPRLSAIRAVVS